MRPDERARLLGAFARVVRPPERMTVSEWADRHRKLTARESAEAGAWRTSRTPYLREIMDAFGDPEVDEVVVRKCSQAGVSEAARNALGYWICQDPGPALWVLPSEKAAREAVDERIRPMVRASIPWEVPDTRDALTLSVLRLRSMEAYIGWAGSAQSLATRPVRYILLDELSKFPNYSGKDAEPTALARARTRTFGPRRKIIMISTPTTRDDAISREFDLCPDRRYYVVPCPGCGVEIQLSWRHVRWPPPPKDVKLRDHAETVSARQLARLRCPECAVELDEAARLAMIPKGRWRSEYDAEAPSRRVAFQLNALVNPWANVSELAAKWMRAQGTLGQVQEFVNQELGEPWEEQVKAIKSSTFRERADRHNYPRGVVPRWAGVVLATADSQLRGFYYMIRAWGHNYRSRLIDWGYVQTFDELRAATLEARFPVEASEALEGETSEERMAARYLLIDAGGGRTHDGDTSITDRVYRFSLTDYGRIVAIRGYPGRRAPRPITTRKIKYTPPGWTRAPYEIIMRLVDTAFYKDVLAHRIASDDMWQECAEIDDEYCRQMSSERKVMRRRRNRAVSGWQQITHDAPNHLWDCAVYQCAAADLAGCAALPNEEELDAERAALEEERCKIQKRRSRSESAGGRGRYDLPSGRKWGGR